jgi:hypothetical protein
MAQNRRRFSWVASVEVRAEGGIAAMLGIPVVMPPMTPKFAPFRSSRKVSRYVRGPPLTRTLEPHPAPRRGRPVHHPAGQVGVQRDPEYTVVNITDMTRIPGST